MPPGFLFIFFGMQSIAADKSNPALIRYNMRRAGALDPKGQGALGSPYGYPKGPKDPNMEYVGFYIRDCNYGFGYVPSIWVLGPLGVGS